LSRAGEITPAEALLDGQLNKSEPEEKEATRVKKKKKIF
jgi:hypothetical protein